MDEKIIFKKDKDRFYLEIGPNLRDVLIEMERHVCSSNAYIEEVDALFKNLKEFIDSKK